jgi:hypothetical protein
MRSLTLLILSLLTLDLHAAEPTAMGLIINHNAAMACEPTSLNKNQQAPAGTYVIMGEYNERQRGFPTEVRESGRPAQKTIFLPFDIGLDRAQWRPLSKPQSTIQYKSIEWFSKSSGAWKLLVYEYNAHFVERKGSDLFYSADAYLTNRYNSSERTVGYMTCIIRVRK